MDAPILLFINSNFLFIFNTSFFYFVFVLVLCSLYIILAVKLPGSICKNILDIFVSVPGTM